MEIEQATQGTTRVKPIKPQARPVKKKESMQGTTSELTSETHPVQARVQDTGGYCTADVTDSDRVHQQRQSSAPIKVVLDQDRLKRSFVGLWTPTGSRAKSRSTRLASFPRS